MTGRPTDGSPEQRVVTDVAAVLGIPAGQVDLERNGLELGLDSVSLMSLATLWSRPGHPVRLVDLATTPTVREWAALLPRP